MAISGKPTMTQNMAPVFSDSPRVIELDSEEKFTREVTQLLEYLQSVIELIICSCKKKNCDSLCYDSKKKGLVCFAMSKCLNCSNIEFDKPEFE